MLIPEAQYADVSLDCFLAVVDDIPRSPSQRGLTEELSPLKDELEEIRGVLIAERMSESTGT